MENDIPNINIPEPKNDLQYVMAGVVIIGGCAIAGGVAIAKSNPAAGVTLAVAGVVGSLCGCALCLKAMEKQHNEQNTMRRILEEKGIVFPSTS